MESRPFSKRLSCESIKGRTSEIGLAIDDLVLSGRLVKIRYARYIHVSFVGDVTASGQPSSPGDSLSQMSTSAAETGREPGKQ
jgi:hypothetical protein